MVRPQEPRSTAAFDRLASSACKIGILPNSSFCELRWWRLHSHFFFAWLSCTINDTLTEKGLQEQVIKVGDYIFIDFPTQAAVALNDGNELENRWQNKWIRRMSSVQITERSITHEISRRRRHIKHRLPGPPHAVTHANVGDWNPSRAI